MFWPGRNKKMCVNILDPHKIDWNWWVRTNLARYVSYISLPSTRTSQEYKTNKPWILLAPFSLGWLREVPNPSFARHEARVGIFLQSPTLFRGGITFNTVNQIARKYSTLFCLDIYFFRFASHLHFFQIFIYPRDDEFPRKMLWTNKNSLSWTKRKSLLDRYWT